MSRSAFVLPPVWLLCIVGALFFKSAVCSVFITLTLAAWLLPPGKVRISAPRQHEYLYLFTVAGCLWMAKFDGGS